MVGQQSMDISGRNVRAGGGPDRRLDLGDPRIAALIFSFQPRLFRLLARAGSAPCFPDGLVHRLGGPGLSGRVNAVSRMPGRRCERAQGGRGVNNNLVGTVTISVRFFRIRFNRVSCKVPVIHVGPDQNDKQPYFKTTGFKKSKHKEGCKEARTLAVFDSLFANTLFGTGISSWNTLFGTE